MRQAARAVVAGALSVLLVLPLPAAAASRFTPKPPPAPSVPALPAATIRHTLGSPLAAGLPIAVSPQGQISRPALMGAAQAAGIYREAGAWPAAGLNELFDKAAGRKGINILAGVGDGGDAPRAPAALGSKDVEAGKKAIHRAYEKAAAKRLAVFRAKLAGVKIGRFGVKLIELPSGVVRLAPSLNGKALSPEEIQSSLASGAITREEAKAFDAAVKPLGKELKAIVFQNKKEHDLAHRKMEEFEQNAALEKLKVLRRKGTDLQAWGLPHVISIDQATRLRYTKIYRMDGLPTDLGLALHGLLAPLVGNDPTFLGRVTQRQLHEAAQALYDGLKYGTDPDSADLQKLLRMGMRMDEGYDYPEWRKAFADLARRALMRRDPGGAMAGLGPVPAERRPAAVLEKELSASIQDLIIQQKAGASAEAMAQGLVLLRAVHAAIGLPMPVGPDEMRMIPVKHDYLRVLVPALRARQVPDNVLEAVVRSFPLGESLWRLGVIDLWPKITGKGVKVAVIDNAVDFLHPDLEEAPGRLKENFTRDRGDHTKGDHATPMASIIRAIAPEAEIQSYQVISNADNLPGVKISAEEFNLALIKALDRARANGAHIINLSMGKPMAYINDSAARKVAELVKAGIVVVASAGNEGEDLPNGYQIRSPGTALEAITVGAVDYHDNKAGFSSAGMVFNPANYTIFEKPELYIFGVNIKAAMRLPRAIYGQEPVPYAHGSGTSPAAPHISGLAALMLEAGTKAGAAVSGAALPQAVKAALLEATVPVNQDAGGFQKIPVLRSAAKAVDEFVKAVAPAPVPPAAPSEPGSGPEA